jgi:hypothetical protein
MSERFLVDFRIAAAERETLFTPDWRWPIPQSAYDDPLREFVEWAYRLPAELGHDEQLRTAFELVESDLLKDLAWIVGAWIDVSTAQQQGLELVYGDALPMYEMLVHDQFERESPMAQARSAGELILWGRSRRLKRFASEKFRRVRSALKGQPTIYTISANTLSNQLTDGRATRIRLAYADLPSKRAGNRNIYPDIPDLANTISKNLFDRLADSGHQQSGKLNSFIHGVVLTYLTAGWQDREFTPGFTPDQSTTLFTGTGSAYLTRVVSHLFLTHGAAVFRSTHGGEMVLFDDPLWASIELPFAGTYMTYGARAAELVSAITARHMSVRGANQQIAVSASGSQYHGKILERASPGSPVKKVYVVSASFSGTFRAIPNVKIHDVVYYDWHRRLLQIVKSAGFTTVSKRHPKGRGAQLSLFDDVASEELKLVGMSDTYELADAYVMDIAGSAFMEALCTLKPIVLVDIPNRRMTAEGRARIGESVSIVRAEFDENNRVVADAEQITEGLHTPVNIEARRRFVSEYLTEPGANLERLMSDATG